MRSLISISLWTVLAFTIGCAGLLGPGGGDDDDDDDDGGEGEGEGEGEELCQGCCFDAATDCGAADVCRFQLDAPPDGAGACTDADGIPYLIGLQDIVVCERNIDGSEWDAGAGAPDPLLEIDVNGVAAFVSVAEQDAFTPGDLIAELELSSTDTVTIFLLDEDLTSNDTIGGYCLGACDGPIGVEALRDTRGAVGDPSCTSDAIASATVFLFPQFN